MEQFTSGNWTVIEGREDEFIAGWQEWLEWTRDNARGLVRAELVRDTEQPRHFVSLAQWQDEQARAAWWKTPGFDERLSALRALCENFVGGNYDLAVNVAGRTQARAA